MSETVCTDRRVSDEIWERVPDVRLVTESGFLLVNSNKMAGNNVSDMTYLVSRQT